MLRPLWAVYNAKFEIRWFDHVVPNQVALVDVDFIAKARIGGSHSSLAVMAKRDLGIDLDKNEQLSDWSEPKLSTSQLQYAAMDAVVTYKLYEKWMKSTEQAHRDAAFIFQDAVRATVECEETGMVLDVEAHQKNIAMWTKKQEIALRRLRKWTNQKLLPNPGSDKQVSDLIKTQLGKETLNAWPKTEKTGQLALNRKIIAPIAAKSPYPFSRWLNALILYRYYRKYLSTYGETLITKQYLADKIDYRLNIAQATTGRYSSSSINIQNIPRNKKVRRAFKPPYGYDCLVVADYSGIEVRVLAELSQDRQLLQDAIYGDVHAGSASAIYHIDEAEFLAVYKDEAHPAHSQYKERRSRAKGFTFQNIYGAAAAALSVVLKCSVGEAEDALRKWAERYPRAYNYRHIMFDHLNRDGYLPVCDGRTIKVHRLERTIPVASNYGIQGAAASVMYRAMHHVYEMRNALTTKSNIVICATVHDELILAAKRGWELQAKEMLVAAMLQGWLDIYPGTSTHRLVEAKIGPTWGDAK
jgi:DNA polymerase-1